MNHPQQSGVVNLLAPASGKLIEERFEVLFQSEHVKIERIVSRQHATPPNQWYDQQTDEYVLLLAGSACLRIEGNDELTALKPGDALLLPAHQRHRVESTDPVLDTIWLAIHVTHS